IPHCKPPRAGSAGRFFSRPAWRAVHPFRKTGVFFEQDNAMHHAQIEIQAGQLYTPDEVRTWLKISRTTLWRYQKAGVLRPVRIGIGSRNPRFRGEEILGVLAGGDDERQRP
ncbi:helix-turn-helix domain-containing protein, partial [Halothiobacillus sp.]|uniref:helix-turn-helix transcriptional regulator n=1 Tax=Halothiobacillus sp. TaxID=1891311 RepID=UPI002631BD25